MPEIVARDMTGGQSSAVESTKEQVVEAAPPTQSAEQLAEKQRVEQLIRREKAIRARARDIEMREKAWQEKQAPPPPKPEEINAQWKQRLAKDPLGTLRDEAGLNPEQIAQILLNANPQDMGIQSLQKENKVLQTRLVQLVASLKTGQEDGRKQALTQIGFEAKQLVKERPEEFEAIAYVGDVGIEAVKQLINRVYDEEGIIMDVREAARDIEEYFVEQAAGYGKLKKVQAQFAPKPPAPKTTIPKKEMSQTLNRQLVQATTKPRMTPSERRERAILAAQGKLV